MISCSWIDEWLHFTHKNSDLKSAPPGQIDNSKLEQILVNENRTDKLRKNHDYYHIAKEVWYFLFNIYGGGPTIIKTTDTNLNYLEDK